MSALRNSINFIDNHYALSVTVAIVLLALWQAVVSMFGFDLCDTGYYLTFFDNIWDAPATVEHNFMYYLSGLIGGVLTRIFPLGGYWLAMRLAGVGCCVGVMVIVGVMLRRVVSGSAVILGLTMVISSLVAFPYTFNHDLLSVLLWTLALACMFKALTRSMGGGVGAGWALMAGVVVGINVFSRIPNVLAICLSLMPFVVGWCYRWRWRQVWSQVASFLLGALLGFVIMVLLLVELGHWPLFVQNMHELLGVATGSSGASTHHLPAMIGQMLRFYIQSLWVGVKLGVPLLLAMLIARRWATPIVSIVVGLAVVVWSVWIMWRTPLLQPLWVMSVAGCVYVMMTQRREACLAALLGLVMLLVFPLGSDGAYNNGAIIAWLAAPVGAMLWRKRWCMVLTLTLIGVGGVQTIAHGAYFDGGALWCKTATINDARAIGIFTTPQRAEIINTTLAELHDQVSPNDELLCYGSIPMMNHLTHTRPAIGCSWPELLSTEALTQRLEQLELSHLPAILRQKFDTIGKQWGQPSDDYLQAYPIEDGFRQPAKLVALNQFMQRNDYRVVWQNHWFALYKAMAVEN